MARSYSELRELTEDELIEEYDRIAQSTSIGLSFIRDEIVRRQTERQHDQMLQLTKEMRDLTGQIRNLTLIILGLTVVNVIAVFISLFAG